MSEQNNGSPLSSDSIVATLNTLPGDLYVSDLKILDIESNLDAVKESLEIAEINASLNAPDDTNEPKRVLKRKKAILEDASCIAQRKFVREMQTELDTAQAENKMIARQFAGYCHMAELRAAQLNLMTKGAVTK